MRFCVYLIKPSTEKCPAKRDFMHPTATEPKILAPDRFAIQREISHRKLIFSIEYISSQS